MSGAPAGAHQPRNPIPKWLLEVDLDDSQQARPEHSWSKNRWNRGAVPGTVPLAGDRPQFGGTGTGRGRVTGGR